MWKLISAGIMVLGFALPLSIHAQTKKAPAKGGTAAAAQLQASLERGKQVYNTFCLACHQADGSGVPRLNPPLYGTEWVTGPKTPLIRMVLEGSSGKVEIDGEFFGNSMPAQKHLTDQQIADVLSYVRNSFGNKAARITPAEVKAERSKIK